MLVGRKRKSEQRCFGVDLFRTEIKDLLFCEKEHLQMRCCFCNFHCSLLSSQVVTMKRVRALFQEGVCLCVCVCVCVCACTSALACMCNGFPKMEIESYQPSSILSIPDSSSLCSLSLSLFIYFY